MLKIEIGMHLVKNSQASQAAKWHTHVATIHKVIVICPTGLFCARKNCYSNKLPLIDYKKNLSKKAPVFLFELFLKWHFFRNIIRLL